MVVRVHRFVAQHIIMPNVVQSSGGSGKKWTLFAILFAASALLGMVSSSLEVDPYELQECWDYYDIYGEYTDECADTTSNNDLSELIGAFSGCFCCGSFIVGIVALSASNASTKTVIVNQGFTPQTTMVQPNTQVIRTGAVVNPAMTGRMPLDTNRNKPSHQSNIQPNKTTQTKPSQTGAPSMDEIDRLSREAKNLELARDFAKAAEMYQKAGLFAEAGRIRQTYLENDKPMVQIGQIGDSVVKDSVIMGEQKSNLCPSCGVVTQPEWNFCPSCNSPL